MTSFTFIFDCVPEPVWNTTSGKCSCSLPEITSSAAAQIASAILGSRPNSLFTVAAAFLSTPNAEIIGSGMRSILPPILKFIDERCVCAPQYLSAGTCRSPNVSRSARNLSLRATAWVMDSARTGMRTEPTMRAGTRSIVPLGTATTVRAANMFCMKKRVGKPNVVKGQRRREPVGRATLSSTCPCVDLSLTLYTMVVPRGFYARANETLRCSPVGKT